MYNRERIKEVIEECLKHYTMGDCTTDKEEKENFVESVMMELDNSNTILIGKDDVLVLKDKKNRKGEKR